MTIADLYRQLEDLTGSPVVRLNRAVAVAEAGDLDAAMALADGLLAELPTNHRLHAVRAEFLTRAGRTTQAGDAYREAISLCANDVERSDLEQRLAFVADPEGQ